MRCFLAGLLMLAYAANAVWAADRKPDPAAEQLGREVRGKGWIVYAARSDKGDWDEWHVHKLYFPFSKRVMAIGRGSIR